MTRAIVSWRKQNYGTPWPLFNAIHARRKFTIDACAEVFNAKLPGYWDFTMNGLKQDAADEDLWINPPYKQISAWAEFARTARSADLLVPSNTETAWYHDLCLPYAHCIRFIRGRIDHVPPPEDAKPPPSFVAQLDMFGDEDPPEMPKGGSPTFPSLLITFRRGAGSGCLFGSMTREGVLL